MSHESKQILDGACNARTKTYKNFGFIRAEISKIVRCAIVYDKAPRASVAHTKPKFSYIFARAMHVPSGPNSTLNPFPADGAFFHQSLSNFLQVSAKVISPSPGTAANMLVWT